MTRTRVVGRLRLPLATCLFLGVACGGDGPMDGLSRDPIEVQSDALTVVWDASSAGSISMMVPIGGERLAVSDRQGVWVVGSDGTLLSVGRGGQGPGEFAIVTGLGRTPTGGLVVLDARLRRATRFHPDGTLAGTTQLRGPTGFGVPRHGPVAILDDSIVVAVWTRGLVDPGGPGDPEAWVAHEPGGGGRSIGEWVGTRWVDSPWAVMPADPFSGPGMVGVDPEDGRVYWSDGAAGGCVFHRGVRETSESADSTCPTVPRVPMQQYVPTPEELERGGLRSTTAEMLSRKHEFQEVAGLADAFQRLFVADGGCLWMRVVKDDAPYDPFLEAQLRDTRPARYEWLLWSPSSEVVFARLLVPNSVEWMAATSDRAFGLVDNDDYTRSVVSWSLPDTVRGCG